MTWIYRTTWDAEASAYVATSKEYPGISGMGETREAAAETLIEMIAEQEEVSVEDLRAALRPVSPTGPPEGRYDDIEGAAV